MCVCVHVCVRMIMYTHAHTYVCTSVQVYICTWCTCVRVLTDERVLAVLLLVQRGKTAKEWYTEGVRGYQRALAHFPGDSASYQNYGIALSALGDLAIEEGDAQHAHALYRNASRQYSFGAVVNPRDSHLLTTWVHTLTSQAKLCTSEQHHAKVALLRRADRVSAQAAQHNAENYFVFDHWGLALSHLGRALASAKPVPDFAAVDECFRRAAEKFARASHLNRDPSSRLNCGLSHWYHSHTCRRDDPVRVGSSAQFSTRLLCCDSG
jgi:tetratricopeptide (TPR) repeat protein